MDEHGTSEEELDQLLEKAREDDFSYGRILSSMCTYPHPLAVKAHIRFIEANLGDPALFPGTKRLEDKIVRMLGALLGKEDVVGYVTTGGTESNIQAIRAGRNSKNVLEPNIVVPESAHFSFDKIGDLLCVDVRKAALNDVFQVDVKSAESLIDENTVALVGIAGTTEFGQIDPIKELSDIALENDLLLHVDAAFGGLVIPFLDEHYDFDFSLEGVSSISVDPHKMGMSTIPAGVLLFRDREHMDLLSVSTPYLVSREQHSLTGTRSGGSAVAAYVVMKHLGREGFKGLVDRCMDLTGLLVSRACEFGVKPVIEPIMNVVALDVPDLDRVVSMLMERRWKVSTTRSPRALRLVIMPHITEETLVLFLDDLEDVVSKV